MRTVESFFADYEIGFARETTGRTMTEAPTHFAQVGAMNANNRYNRFVTLIRVDNDGDHKGTGAEQARLACSGMAMMTVEGPGEAMQRYYDRVDNDG